MPAAGFSDRRHDSGPGVRAIPARAPAAELASGLGGMLRTARRRKAMTPRALIVSCVR